MEQPSSSAETPAGRSPRARSGLRGNRVVRTDLLLAKASNHGRASPHIGNFPYGFIDGEKAVKLDHWPRETRTLAAYLGQHQRVLGFAGRGRAAGWASSGHDGSYWRLATEKGRRRQRCCTPRFSGGGLPMGESGNRRNRGDEDQEAREESERERDKVAARRTPLPGPLTLWPA